jgi:hypothetical protein
LSADGNLVVLQPVALSVELLHSGICHLQQIVLALRWCGRAIAMTATPSPKTVGLNRSHKRLDLHPLLSGGDALLPTICSVNDSLEILLQQSVDPLVLGRAVALLHLQLLITGSSVCVSM